MPEEVQDRKFVIAKASVEVKTIGVETGRRMSIILTSGQCQYPVIFILKGLYLLAGKTAAGLFCHMFKFFFFDGEGIGDFIFNGVRNTDFKLCMMDYPQKKQEVLWLNYIRT